MKHNSDDYFSLSSESRRKQWLINLGCEIHNLLENILTQLSSKELHVADNYESRDPGSRQSVLGQPNNVLGGSAKVDGFEKRGPGRPRNFNTGPR